MPKKHLGMLLIVISALIASIPFSLPVIEKEAALEKGPRVAMEQKVQIRKTTRGKEKKSFWPQEAYRTLFAGSLPLSLSQDYGLFHACPLEVFREGNALLS
ncbi:MAG TPA: hypothetical protein VGL94_13570 [Ktedonobacteraceae bacterium]|jgi:hypothetical protein